MKVRYTPRAFAEREAIFDYLNDRNPKAAHDIVGLIARRIAGLADEPHKGHKTDRRGIYTLWIAPTRYRVFYRIDGDDIVVIHIRHTSRRSWPSEEE
jgi:toxin ParE1/3/4